MPEQDFFPTVINPDIDSVDLPLNLALEWFDKFRQGVVGIISLVPSGQGDGSWTLHIAEIPDVVAELERLSEAAEGGS